MNSKFIVIALFVILAIAITKMPAASWSYDFGTGSDYYTTPNTSSTTYLQDQPAGGGTHRVRVASSGGGGFYRDDPGLPDFGSDTELRIETSSSSGSGNINKYSVYGYTGGTGQLGRKGYFRTQFRIGDINGDMAYSGTLYFFLGTGTSYSNDDVIATDHAIVGIRWVINGDGSLTTSWMVDNAWTSFTGMTFVQGETYVMEFFTNNGSGNSRPQYTYNGVEYTVTSPAIDFWVNGTLVGDELDNAWTIAWNNAFDSFMFYGESSTDNEANIFLDSMQWANTFDGFTPTYTDFYSKSTGNLNTLATWGSNPDGSGTAPLNFTDSGITYHIRNNAEPTIGANWTVSGTGSKVILGDGVNDCKFIVPGDYYFTGLIDVNNLGVLDLQNSTLPTLGTLYTGSTVRYGYAGNQNVYGVTYYNLDIYNTGTKTMLGDVTVNNLLDFSSSGALALAGYDLYLMGQDLYFENPDTVILTEVDVRNEIIDGLSINRVWTTGASSVTSVDLTFRYSTGESTSTTMALWYRDGSGVWTWMGDYTATDGTDGYMYVTVTGVDDLGTDREWTFTETYDTLDLAYADIKVFLHGPYVTGGTMNSYLVDYLPLDSPYNDESVVALPDVSPKNIVDWIFVELRESVDGEFVQSLSAFLLDDGSVVNLDGIPGFEFSGVIGNDYYIVVRHRNHLGIQSSGTHTFSNDPDNPTLIDLTALDSVYGGNSLGIKLVDTGVLAMYSGDVNGDGIVDTIDLNLWRQQTGSGGYYSADMNLDDTVNTVDRNNCWRPHSGKESQIPEIAPAP